MLATGGKDSDHGEGLQSAEEEIHHKAGDMKSLPTCRPSLCSREPSSNGFYGNGGWGDGSVQYLLLARRDAHAWC